MRLEGKLLALRELVLDQRDYQSLLQLKRNDTGVSGDQNSQQSTQSSEIIKNLHPSPEIIKKLHPSSEIIENLHFDESFYRDLITAETTKISDKVSTVSSNISKACRSLSGGLNDVQEVAVELINWSDKVHTAFEVISEKLFLPRNVCPRMESSFHAKNYSSDHSNTIGRKR